MQGIPSLGVCACMKHVHEVWHPLGRLGLCLGVPCMLQGWDILVLLHHFLISTLGQHFPKLGLGIANALQLHSQQGLWLPSCGAVTGMGPLCMQRQTICECIHSVPAQRSVEE